MDAQHWKDVARLYEAAAEMAVEDRGAFLAGACDDDRLRQEVESLLSQDRQQSPLDRPLWADASAERGRSPLLPIGTHVGPYRVDALVGSGGMGNVYRAYDSRLERSVALKVLADAVVHDSDRLERLMREAQVLASLDHPNIAAIHGLEDRDGIHALVLELVPGPTLTERLAQGPLPVDEAIVIAVQIANALEAAHERGIVHRDLKPANISFCTDGTVKILDFGLAKRLEAAGGSTTRRCSSVDPIRGAGAVLGTAAYMSPEQAKGDAGGKRSDVWAFGCVLYEMITATRAFPGKDVAETLAAVQRSNPAWDALPSTVPPSLRRLLRRCLNTDQRNRLADFGDVRLELEEASRELALPRTRRLVRTRRIGRLAWTLAGVATVIAGAFGVIEMLDRRGLDDTRPRRFSLSPPEGWRVMAADAAPAGALAVSPDGNRLAFLAVNTTGESALWIRSFETVEAKQLPGTEGARGGAPFWSPDGRYVGFYASGKLRKIDVLGGSPTPICDTADFRGGTWSSQGIIVFAPGARSPLLKVSASGGAATPATRLAAVEPGHFRPSFLPDGRRFLYYVANFGGIYAGSLDSDLRKLLFASADTATAQYSNGHVLLLRQSTLVAQRLDLQQLTLLGDAIPIANGIERGDPPVGMFSVSETGVLAFQPRADTEQGGQLVWMNRQGNPAGSIPGERRAYTDLSLSPAGKQLVFSLADRTRRGGRDLWIMDVAHGVPVQFTTHPADDQFPIWSPDGSIIAFSSRRRGHSDLYTKPSQGSTSEEPLLVDEREKVPLSWSADSERVLYRVGAGLQSSLWVLEVTTKKTYELEGVRADALGGARLSPDGRWIVYTSTEAGGTHVYVSRAAGGGRKWPVSTVDGGSQPRWRRDGQEIYYRSPRGELMAAELKVDSSIVTIRRIRSLFSFGTPGRPAPYDVSDGWQRFLVAESGTVPDAPPLTVVLDWTTLLK